jgi:hypothetical protein
VTNMMEPPIVLKTVEEAMPEIAKKVDPILFEQYKIMVDSTTEITKNRQSANTFYLAVNTFILGAVSLVQNIPKLGIPLLCLTGIVISALWYVNIISFKNLNHAKFTVIKEMEISLPVQLFTKEETVYKRLKHIGLTRVEKCIPLTFCFIHIVVLLYNILIIL